MDKFFAELPVESTGRQMKAVGEIIIDRLHPRRAGIAHPGRLHRRGFARKNRQTVGGRVSGQVNQDVDSVRADGVGKLDI